MATSTKPTPHTYGPTCALYDDSKNLDTADTSCFERAPKVKAQFFYTSNLPIDDPLSPLPALSSSSQQSKAPPQPFSARDNAALEEAWMSLQIDEKKQDEHNHEMPTEDNPSGKAEKQRGRLRRGAPDHSGEEPLVDIKSTSKKAKDTSQQSEEASRPNAGVKESSRRNTRSDESDSRVMLEDYHEHAWTEAPLDANELAEGGEGTGASKKKRKEKFKETSPARLFRMKSVVATDESHPTGEQPDSITPKTKKKAKESSPSRLFGKKSVPLSIDVNKLAKEHLDDEGSKKKKDKESSNSKRFRRKLKINVLKEEVAADLRALDATDAEIGETMRLMEQQVHAADDGEGGDEGDTPEAKRSWFRLRAPFYLKDVRRNNASQGRSPTSNPFDDPPNRAGDTSGKPFARAPSRSASNSTAQRSNIDGTNDIEQLDGANDQKTDASTEAGEINQPEGQVTAQHKPRFQRLRTYQSRSESESPNRDQSSWLPLKNKKDTGKTAYVPVGMSRLHLVEMPDLQMKPIYWNPIHDISTVLRGTWFYKSTMLPVEPEVAILLEAGYEYMRPWTSTWQDELNSCVANGAEAELKVVHRLWPTEETPNRPGTGKEIQKTTAKDNAKSPNLSTVPANQAAGSTGVLEDSQRLFKNFSVVYINARDAQILRPSLLPSASRSRKPLSYIRAGREIGVALVRGFDRNAWEKLHPPKQASPAKQQPKTANIAQSEAAITDDQRKHCEACEQEAQKNRVSDLILVIHGIGQKLSERVESFHFTHAINAFRRQVNVELTSEQVKPHLRSGFGGIMVLPINWRSLVQLDDPEELSAKKEGAADNSFGLKDITPDTLPAIRNIISDVMLDIPYYLSHHKSKMIEAVIKEANRVYRLWCRNNPAFQDTGRVHLIAHSLGSVMAMDILSKQPTKLPKGLDLKSKKVHDYMFEFDTKNLFFAGSPAGFFLLLNRSHLVPRKGRDKPGTDREDEDSKVVAEPGTYGSMAVDNLYNVMHYNDPIAYRVNAAVDTDYAASLKPATIPSSTTSWFSALNIFRIAPAQWSSSGNAASVMAVSSRPAIKSMPSAVEMETHDFSREEIAEKRMLLLNDNGQIDYVLSSGGGPLEIQYVNMLSAHSSYWVLQDFVRFLVVECGREPGKNNALMIMRAAKKKQGRVGKE